MQGAKDAMAQSGKQKKANPSRPQLWGEFNDRAVSCYSSKKLSRGHHHHGNVAEALTSRMQRALFWKHQSIRFTTAVMYFVHVRVKPGRVRKEAISTSTRPIPPAVAIISPTYKTRCRQRQLTAPQCHTNTSGPRATAAAQTPFPTHGLPLARLPDP